jgi:hypothetical protein
MSDDQIPNRQEKPLTNRQIPSESPLQGVGEDLGCWAYWKRMYEGACESLRLRTGQTSKLRADVARLEDVVWTLKQQISMRDQQIADLSAERGVLQTQYAETDRRLGVMLSAGSMSDRGSLSISGSDSQPDRISQQFVEFRVRVEEIVRTAKKHAQLTDANTKRQFGPQNTGALSFMLFSFGSSKLGLNLSAPEFISPVDIWARFRAGAGVSDVAEVQMAIIHACAQAIELVRNVVLSTAPHEPGQVVFPVSGSEVDSNMEVFPGCVDGGDAVVSQTVFPGYHVGESVWVKPMVWTRVA